MKYSKNLDPQTQLFGIAPKALANLCEVLTSTKTQYPGTNLKLVYSVKTDK